MTYNGGNEFLQKAFSLILVSQKPLSPGINFEPIHNRHEKNLRSVRIDRDYRGILLAPEEGNVFVLLWIDHHDAAYSWAQKKRVKIHPETGALQVYSLDEAKASRAREQRPQKKLFRHLSDRQLSRLGVPEDLNPLVRSIETEAQLDRAQEQLPPDAYDALFYCAAGESYQQVMQDLERKEGELPFDQDDYQAALASDESKRKFWVVDNEEELQRMLEEPLEKWRVFLHPLSAQIGGKALEGPCARSWQRRHWENCCGDASRSLGSAATCRPKECPFHHLHLQLGIRH